MRNGDETQRQFQTHNQVHLPESMKFLLEATVSMVLLSVPYISSFVIMYQYSICTNYFLTSSIHHLFVLVDIFIEFISSRIDGTEA